MRFVGFAGFVVLLGIVSLTTASIPDVKDPANSQNVEPAEEDEDFVPYQGERFNVFDWNLFKTMGKRYPGNLLISPISIKLALVLLFEGAQGQSAYELANVLQLPVSRASTRDRFVNVLRSLQMSCPEYTLNIGTRMYVDSGILTRQRYEAIVKTFYGTDVLNVNMNQTAYIAENVNSWVSNVTLGNIPRLINDAQNLKDEVMLVINAIFFRGTWRRDFFSPNSTIMGKFSTPTENVTVPYMNTFGRFYYSESPTLDSQILRLPYNGNKFALYIVLPRTVNGLDHVLGEINQFVLTRHVWLMQDLPIEVSIPKFKFDFTSHLENTLRELGIRDIFDNTATLTGIARTRRASRHLYVSDIVQKTGIDVSEQGTTAYVATDLHIGNKIADQTFFAHRPFVFYIEDESTGTILYVGKVVNPLQTNGETGNVPFDLPSRLGETGGTANPAPTIGKTTQITP